ncbi:MAG: endonuclease/exonuclease/phosphatase family protein, partial [Desulfosarcina sp.]|nr:endonuclease/exonuclease/phosphatase family protein [Desulfosarcina sp.]
MEYWKLKYLNSDKRRRAIRHLKTLRRFLDAQLPQRTAQGTLVLGTWNIRNFDDNRFRNGPRVEESFFLIAEVISRFDAIAVQEICRDLRPVERLMSILGHEYDFILTDVTEGRSGNKERLGFIYHRDKVSFQGIAGEIVLPEKLLISDVTKKRQFARTPFACAFQSGWLSFMFATVHIYYGNASKKADAYKRRVKEIESVARFLAKRAKQEDQTYILVGDFNIEKFGDATADALEEANFTIVRNKEGSNRTQTKFYDQISFIAREGELRMADSDRAHGVLRLFDTLFRDNDFDAYDSDVDATLAAKLEALAAKQQAWEAKKPSKTQTKELKALEKAIEETKQTRANKNLRKAYYLNE